MEKLRSSINRILSERRSSRESGKYCPVSFDELKGVIILHVLATSYGESPSTMCSTREQDAFLQMGIREDRYKEVWSALFCTTGKRSRATHIAGKGEEENPTWTNKSERANALIAELEQETGAINTKHLNINGFTPYSRDDDHHRLSSTDVSQLRNLQQMNNPSEALGPVSNAVRSALVPVILACHHSRAGESLMDEWARLVQIIRGK